MASTFTMQWHHNSPSLTDFFGGEDLGGANVLITDAQ